MLKSRAKAYAAAQNIRAKRAANNRAVAEGRSPAEICLWSWKVPEGAALADVAKGPAEGAEGICVPVDREFLTEINTWGCFCEAPETKSAVAGFFDILAGSVDARLREAAACVDAWPKTARRSSRWAPPIGCEFAREIKKS